MDPARTPADRTAAQRAGDHAEAQVARHLAACGWRILARNLRVGRAELDIVAVDPGPPPMLVVVEVRWRRSREFGLPEETLTLRKRAVLRQAAGRLLDGAVVPGGPSLPRLPVRLDLVAVEPGASGAAVRVRHYRGAIG